MPLEIINSIDINSLTLNLIENIDTEMKKYGAFHSPLVITPNLNLKKMISLKYAEVKNICANINFMPLEEGLTYSLKKNYTKNETEDFIFLNHKENHIYLELIILSILLDKKKASELEFFYDYLGDETKKKYLIKAWQTSVKLAVFFREYEYHREELINSWIEGKLEFQKKNENDFIKKVEKAEKFIYEKIFCQNEIKDQLRKKLNREYITLPRYIKNISSDVNIKSNFNGTIFIFALSQISTYHYKLILKLSAAIDIKIFQLNYFQLSENSFNENKILNDMGIPQKENLSVFENLWKKEKTNQIKKTFLPSRYERNEKILDILKSSILFGNQKDFKKNKSQDDSFQILGCPTQKKEIESVYNNIIYNLKNDDKLKITDIAVLVNNINNYTDIIKSVFDTPPDSAFNFKDSIFSKRVLPYNLSDSNAKTESLLGKYIIKALELSSSPFSRKYIFDFIENPFFLKSQNITSNEIKIFLEWTERLNVFYGYDDEDKKKYSCSDSILYTWEFGLKRLRFARIMETYKFEDRTNNFFDIIPFEDINSQDEVLLDKFIAIIEKLFGLLINLNQKKNMPAWILDITDFINIFFEIPESYKEEHKVLNKLIESLNKLNAFENIFSDSIDIVFIIEFLKKEISKINSGSGSYLTDGITISSMMPARPIPFKIIYLVGLNENNFPGNKDNLILDLRNVNKIPGDVSKVEANNFLFLETLFSAQEKLFITYQSKNLEKDEDFYISTTVRKLINYLNDKILENDFIIYDLIKSKNISHNFFLSLESSFNYEERFEAFLSGKYILNKNDLADIKKKYLSTQSLFEKNKNLTYKKNIENISLSNIYDYILNPINGKIKLLLEIHDHTEQDLSLKEYENFYSDKYQIKKLLKNAMQKKISDMKTNISSMINENYKFNNLTGNTPDGIFSLYDKKNVETEILDMINNPKISEMMEKNKNNSFIKKISLTENYNIDPSSIYFPLLTIKPDDKNAISINAELENLFYNKDEKKLEIYIISGSEKTGGYYKYFIKPFIFYFMLYCGKEKNSSGISSYEFIKNLTFTISILFKDDIISYEIPKNISENEITGYIVNLAECIIENKSYDIIPYEIIMKKNIISCFEKENKKEFFELIGEELDNTSGFNDINKYSPFLKIVKASIPENIHDIVKYRYKYFIDIFKKNTEKTNARS